MSQDKKTYYRNIAYTAILLALASLLSVLEGIFISPFTVPGVKIGLANICVFAAFFFVSKTSAFLISLFRPVLVFLLYSNPYSFAISLCGALLSYLALFSLGALKGRIFTFIGISSFCAFIHICGQFFAASMLLSMSVWTYFPLSAFLAVLSGVITGILMNVLFFKMHFLRNGEKDEN